MILEKINQFSEDKYDVDVSAAQITADFEEKRGDSAAVIEALSITQRFVSTCKRLTFHSLRPDPLPCLSAKLVAQHRQESPGASPVGRSASTASTATFSKKAPPPPPAPFGSGKTPAGISPAPSTYEAPPPPYAPAPHVPSPHAPIPRAATVHSTPSIAASAASKRAPPPPPPLKPKPAPPVNYVVALYDFSAQADGDLDFNVGDRIEVVERTQSTEDWWTGRLEGRTGVFPGGCQLSLLYSGRLSARTSVSDHNTSLHR